MIDHALAQHEIAGHMDSKQDVLDFLVTEE